MKKSFFVQTILNIDDNGLFVSVDMEKTNTVVNELLLHIQAQGFEVEMITPVISGVGQFEHGSIQPKGIIAKWMKHTANNFSYGFGYSYTTGFIVLAKFIKTVKQE